MYHYTPPWLRDSFESQIYSLLESGYAPIGLDQLVEGLNGKHLPDKPVAITFDDGWRNQYDVAFQVLQKYYCPAAFFIVTNYANAGSNGDTQLMPWEKVKEMSDFGMTIGNHSVSHPDLVAGYYTYGRNWLMSQLENSKAVIEDITGRECYAFAYPYGSRDWLVTSAAEMAGYRCACDAWGGNRQSSDAVFNLKRMSMGAEIPLNVMHRRIQQ